MSNGATNLRFEDLSEWHKALLSRLLDVGFPGKQELKAQVIDSRFSLLDQNRSLEIHPASSAPAPVTKTIPVEAYASDVDGMPIQALLFTRAGLAYMFEILRGDGETVKQMPPAREFNVTVLGV